MVTERFKEMALSFAGCDGGNLQSEVWFCGMEWGGSQDNAEKVASEFDAQSYPSSWQDKSFESSWNAQYNQKICWFLHYFYDLYWERMSYQKFIETYKIMYRNSDGCGFKMNMFPIRFKGRKDVTWDGLSEATGFDSFHAYCEWCVIHRGAFFRKLIDEHKPKLVVCTGIEEKENFFHFFTGKASFDAVDDCKDFSLFYARYGNTLICVSPFFGRPINSYAKMEELVEKIKNRL